MAPCKSGRRCGGGGGASSRLGRNQDERQQRHQRQPACCHFAAFGTSFGAHLWRLASCHQADISARVLLLRSIVSLGGQSLLLLLLAKELELQLFNRLAPTCFNSAALGRPTGPNWGRNWPLDWTWRRVRSLGRSRARLLGHLATPTGELRKHSAACGRQVAAVHLSGCARRDCCIGRTTRLTFDGISRQAVCCKANCLARLQRAGNQISLASRLVAANSESQTSTGAAVQIGLPPSQLACLLARQRRRRRRCLHLLRRDARDCSHLSESGHQAWWLLGAGEPAQALDSSRRLLCS